MKAQIALFIIGILGNVLYAQSSFSQTKVSLNLNNVTIETLFDEIEKQTGFVVLHKEDIPLKNKTSISVSNERIETVLKQTLVPMGLEYHVNGKQIIVSKSKTKVEQKQNAPQRSIKGIVADKDQEPLIGVYVLVKGSNKGTVTDIDGKYTLEVSDNDVLVYSFLGLGSQEYPVKGKNVLDVMMLEDSQVMDEVVVVGFGVQKKINLTGAIGVVKGQEISGRTTGNALLALQGQAAGFNVVNTSAGGQLDAIPELKIRGGKPAGAGSASGSPLVLIDGMEGSLSNINPQDIDNISVLKDAAASAIYGTRAPYGVVLVTTKSGKNGRSVVSYSNNFRWNTPIFMPKMANSWEYVSYFNDANYNNGGSYMYDPDHVQKIKDYVDGKIDPNVTIDQVDVATDKWLTSKAFANVDWLEKYYKKWSASQEHNLSLSGGKDNITYYISANFQDQQGFMNYGGDNRQRYTLTGKISAKVNEIVKFDFVSRFSRFDYKRPSRMTDSFFEEVLRRSVPFHPETDPNGYYLSGNTFVQHLLEGGKTKDQNEDLSQQLKVTITPIKNWNIMGEINARVRNDWTHSDVFNVYSHYATQPEKTYLSSLSEQNSLSNSIYEYASRKTSLTPTLYSNYRFSVGQHNFAPMVGIQLDKYNQRILNARRWDITSEEVKVIDGTTSLDPKYIKLTGNTASLATLGFFGRMNYDYSNRFLLEGNIRVDGASRFRTVGRWITTASGSFGWNIAEESFFEPVTEYIPYLKLRVSYGTLANQNTNDFYPTYPVMGGGTGNGQWILNGLRPNTATAPGLVSTSLTWETVTTGNLGVDWGAFNNRLTGSFDVFQKDMKNLMGPGVELPATLGTKVPDQNNTDLRQRGFELSIQWKDRINEFSYSAELILSDALTRVMKYPNPTGSLDNFIEGELVGDIYGYTSLGIAQSDEQMQNHINALKERRGELGFDPETGGQPTAPGVWTAGDVMYEDTNNDGIISRGANTIYDKGDLKVIGNTTPRYETGIKLGGAWRGLDIAMFWQGVLKRDFFPSARTDANNSQSVNMVFWGITPGGQHWSTAFKEHLDYWRDETSPLGANYDAYYPRPLINSKNKVTQTLYLQNASYMRLKNLQIGYTLPVKWTNKVGLSLVRIFASGENLLTFTSVKKVLDPESGGYGAKGGVTYPLAKTYACGVNVSF